MQSWDDQIKNLFSIGIDFFFQGIGLMQSWDDQIKNLFSDWLFFRVWDQCNLLTIKSKTCFLLGLTFFRVWDQCNLGTIKSKVVFYWDWLFFRVWDQCNLGTIKSKVVFYWDWLFFQGMGPMQSWDGQIKNLFSIRIDFFRFGRCVVLYWKRKKTFFL